MQEELVYQTKSASISQCDIDESFVLSLEKQNISLKLCELISLKKKINQIDIITLLETDTPDIEIIHLPHCDRFLVLSVLQILEFRELLNGAFNILALNSSIQRILRKGFFNF